MVDASIIIVTRNRREVAAQAITSALAQRLSTPDELEILVLDDGSSDATADFVREKFPTVRVERNEQQGGYIVRRNQAFNLANGPIIFSLDDDAVFTEPSIVADILRAFDEPRVGAVAIPFVNHYDGEDHKSFPDPPDDGTPWIKNTFIGTAFAVRKDVFNRLGGFQEKLYHWGEESEYSQRLFAAGYVVRAGRSAQIRHYPKGAGKYNRKINRYIHRNFILSAYFNAPFSYLLPILGLSAARSIVETIKHPRELPAILEGTAMAYAGMLRFRSLRRPLAKPAYQSWLKLRKEKFVSMDQIRTSLPVAQF